MLGIIYKATNRKNGKVYIGQTTTTLAERRKQHILIAMSSNQRKYSFQLAIKKHGEANFQWSVIDVANTQEELNRLEMKWIAHYESYLDAKKGYNRTLGGNAFPEEEQAILHYDYKGNFIAEYPHSYEASEKLNFDRRGIRRSCQSKCMLYRGHIFLYRDDFSNRTEAECEARRRSNKLNILESCYYLAS